MCGIFVVFSKKGSQLPKKKCLSASNELYNRGPDFFKYTFLRKNTLYISNNILSVTGKTNTNKRLVYRPRKEMEDCYCRWCSNYHCSYCRCLNDFRCTKTSSRCWYSYNEEQAKA